MDIATRWRPWVGLAAALLLLNASLTFQNAWPTPWIRWQGSLSVELAMLLLALLAWQRVRGGLSRTAVACVSAIWTFVVICHYVDVTAPALYGREINLYWDLRFVPDVIALLVLPKSWWIVVLTVVIFASALGVTFWMSRLAWRRVAHALTLPRERLMMGAIAAVVTIGFFVLPAPPPPAAVDYDEPPAPLFVTPVTATYARQAQLVIEAMTRTTSLAPSPSMDADFSGLGDADVFLIFLESYGAVTFDRHEMSEQLAASRAGFDAAIRETGREVVSAFAESPTFGGNSWLAHLSLMSGIEVREPRTNALLMTQKRETMVTAFSRRGFRTIGLMPGVQQTWPEGSFYGFDEIYDAWRLDYRGPEFGWFTLPDQFAVAKLDQVEVDRASRGPLFVVFPTIGTHAPFRPVPPYQPDWKRLLTDKPYDEADVERVLGEEPDWMDLGPSYVESMANAYTWLAGYVRQRAGRDYVLILIGDHQPPAAVTGEGAPWDVPVHVIGSRKTVLDRLTARGFTPGLTPARPVVCRMHGLVPIFFEAFAGGD